MMQRRLFHAAIRSRSAESSASPLPVLPTKVVYKKSRSGTFFGTLLGFAAGLAAAGASSYWQLLEEYQVQANTLIAAVDNVQRSTKEMEGQLQRVSAVERLWKQVQESAATKNDLLAMRKELLKVTDASMVEHLALKTRVWELQQELQALQRVQQQEPKPSVVAPPSPSSGGSSTTAPTTKPADKAPAKKPAERLS